MPLYLRGDLRDQLRFVLLNTRLCYGFRTKDLAAGLGVSAGELADALGHMDLLAAQSVASRILVTGANSPKPARVAKKTGATGTDTKASTSTFCAYNKLAAATAAGWRLAKPARPISINNGGGTRTRTAVATLSNGVLYAFPLNKADFTAVGTALGLQPATAIVAAERIRLVAGSRSTRPGEAAKRADNGILSTYYSTAQQATLEASDEWKVMSTERIEFAELPSTP